ncbi:Ubiquinone/menaquinone biosynthesis C-methylase UbiE [Salinihabitans flavidus]|uniref:Ubiquinone/menaquinone biosynthesis C-methylase UbiE n=1 Tax=Salinihabitans flavidus TaxID=569882 RepID=A0A1H8SXX9_9RHOB|nr:class I SAM-dependent methyltransferase [Salinihabitans flavidus]SEO83552.1 Ubiquinone/menaquinone biosynthesis C-methylase UbiE [Salinihabitans flavidus]
MTTATMQEASEYVDFWNRVLVPKFIRFRHILAEGTSNHSDQVLPTLGLEEGDRVVDIGCGFGDTAIELARRVGWSGAVLGIDCCDAFLDFGRREAAAAGISNLTFVEADVLTHRFEPVHDACFSRFGTQFFENPVAGLRNMRAALKPGGTMTMIVWRALEDNPCMNLPKQVILRFLPAPEDDADTCGPGPFSMADQSVVRRQLEAAGFEAIAFERVDAPVVMGKSLDDAVDFQLAIGPAGEIYREAGTIAEQRHEDIVAALKRELAPFERPEGIVMSSGSWKVTARNPR